MAELVHRDLYFGRKNPRKSAANPGDFPKPRQTVLPVQPAVNPRGTKTGDGPSPRGAPDWVSNQDGGIREEAVGGGRSLNPRKAVPSGNADAYTLIRSELSGERAVPQRVGLRCPQLGSRAGLPKNPPGFPTLTHNGTTGGLAFPL